MLWKTGKIQAAKLSETEAQACYRLINVLQACRLDVIQCSEKPAQGPLLTTLWDFCCESFAGNDFLGAAKLANHPILFLNRYPRLLDLRQTVVNQLPPLVTLCLKNFDSDVFTKTDPPKEFFLLIGNMHALQDQQYDFLIANKAPAFQNWENLKDHAAKLYGALRQYI